MGENTTNPSNDESREEISQERVSDDEVRKLIGDWGDGEQIYIASVAVEFEGVSKESDSSNSGASDTSGSKVKVTSTAKKELRELTEDPLLTVGAKKQNEKTKTARKAKKDGATKKNEDREEK